MTKDVIIDDEQYLVLLYGSDEDINKDLKEILKKDKEIGK